MRKPKSKGEMGFKDRWTFNMVLLAKQSWHVMANESTMLHKLYEAKYFSKTNFMDAKLDPSPSYTWWKFWEVYEILLEGCKWKMGDGHSIDI